MEEKTITLKVLGEPMGKQRPRATFVAGHATIYTPKKTQSYEGRFASAYGEKYPNTPPTSEAVKVTIYAYFGLLKGDYNSKGSVNKKGMAKLNGETHCTKKPDTDNIAKAVLDGLNGVAFLDDSQVVSLTIIKTYSIAPRVEVAVEILDKPLSVVPLIW